MNAATLLLLNSPLWSPALFALLVMLSVVLGWQALAPNQPKEAVQTRLNSYLQRGHSVEDAELTKPFGSRVLAPAFRRLLGLIGAIAPKRNAEMTRQMLLNAGEPGHLTVLDFLGLRILGAILLGCIGLYLTRGQALLRILLFAGSAGLLGYLAPIYWLRAKANGRKRAIQRALPDALDMLTIGVEAGPSTPR
jgi:tight adherence protein C